MRISGRLVSYSGLLVGSLLTTPGFVGTTQTSILDTDFSVMKGEIGRFGGTLLVSQRSEPKTLNPLIATDSRSKEIIGLLSGDLIHINSLSFQTEPALASSWTVSPDHLTYVLHLRHGVRFSDGSPLNAADVVFSFGCYLDERVHAPQRDLLIISGKPIAVKSKDDYTVSFTLAKPYAAAERLFDSIAILPKHLLQQSYDRATLATAWTLNTPPAAMAGLGPFRVREYAPGQRIVLERNPFYWKTDEAGRRLPYLDRIVCLFVANGDAEAVRFDSGETDVISRLTAGNFALLAQDQKRRAFHVEDIGSGLEYDFLFFNQNAVPERSASFKRLQSWFGLTEFRQAVSNAIDRDAIARVVYRERADTLASQVTPGNKLWINHDLHPPVRSVKHAAELLRQSGFSWDRNELLLDRDGVPVRLSLTVNASNSEQLQMATMIQQDLKELGILLQFTALEFHTLLDRIYSTYDYEAAILRLADGDADPNSEINVLSSTGSGHFWQLKLLSPPPSWQSEIDGLMQQQMTVTDYRQRKRLYDRVQMLIGQNVPVIYLISPHILVGARNIVGNFRPAILGSNTLWNAEQIFLRPADAAQGR